MRLTSSLTISTFERSINPCLSPPRPFDPGLPVIGAPEIKGLQEFTADGSSSNAPGIFEPRVLALLPEVKKSIESCWKFLGLPDGLRRLNMEFDIFPGW